MGHLDGALWMNIRYFNCTQQTHMLYHTFLHVVHKGKAVIDVIKFVYPQQVLDKVCPYHFLAMGKRGLSSSSSGPPAQMPPGGFRQKADWAAHTAAEAQRPSALARYLVQRWSWGHMSLPVMQQIAMRAISDGADHPDLKALSSLGTSGLHPNNMHKELMNKLEPPPIRNALTNIKVYFKKENVAAVIQADTSILLPHKLFATLFNEHREAFNEHILGGSLDNPKRFWAAMSDNAAYLSHPLKDRKDHKEKAIPLSLHGDGVPIAGLGKSWSKSVDAWSWASVLGRGSTACTNWMIYILYWKLIVDAANMNAFHIFSRQLKWSLYWLFIGKHPNRDEHDVHYTPESPEGRLAGTSLAGGYYGVLWLIRGDLDHMAKAFGFPYATAASPCGCCQANSTDKPWTDGRLETAAWATSIWTHDSWKAAHPNPHPIFTLPGVGIKAFVPDVMHVLHLGTYQYFFGSVLHYLTTMIMPESPQSNLAKIWTHIKTFYKDWIKRCIQQVLQGEVVLIF